MGGTALGSGISGQLVFPVKNIGASVLEQGLCVAIIDFSSVKYLDDSIVEDILPVATYASGGNNQLVGATRAPIPAGAEGEIVLLGLCKVVAATAIVAGAAIGPTAVGRWDDAASTLPGALDCGIAIEAAAGAGSIFLAFINCLSWDGSYQAP